MVAMREIRAERVRRGIKAQDMAELLGMKLDNYRTRESGKVCFSDREKAEMTRIFGWSYDQMNRFLYDGVLPNFFDPKITER